MFFICLTFCQSVPVTASWNKRMHTWEYQRSGVSSSKRVRFRMDLTLSPSWVKMDLFIFWAFFKLYCIMQEFSCSQWFKRDTKALKNSCVIQCCVCSWLFCRTMAWIELPYFSEQGTEKHSKWFQMNWSQFTFTTVPCAVWRCLPPDRRDRSSQYWLGKHFPVAIQTPERLPPATALPFLHLQRIWSAVCGHWILPGTALSMNFVEQ